MLDITQATSLRDKLKNKGHSYICSSRPRRLPNCSSSFLLAEQPAPSPHPLPLSLLKEPSISIKAIFQLITTSCRTRRRVQKPLEHIQQLRDVKGLGPHGPPGHLPLLVGREFAEVRDAGSDGDEQAVDSGGDGEEGAAYNAVEDEDGGA